MGLFDWLQGKNDANKNKGAKNQFDTSKQREDYYAAYNKRREDQQQKKK
jgi:hypothetical protein